jgi:hypothetical protein
MHPAVLNLRLRAVAVLVALGLSAAVARGQPVETPSFVYIPPAGWASNAAARPITVTGPRKEVLRLSIRPLPASGAMTDAAAARRNAEAAAVRALEQLIKDERLTIVRPVARRQLADGTAISELEARTPDRQRTLAGFVVIGPRAALLATLAIPGAPALTVTAVRQSLEKIQWR